MNNITKHPAATEISAFLAEDIGPGDITAEIIPKDISAKASVISRESAVICGQPWFDAIFNSLSPAIAVDWVVPEGTMVKPNSLLCRLKGPARALLSGERTALNLLQTLSATATIARSYADKVAGTGCKVLDTRKTLPGLRLAQKYAVRCGGCYNHRVGLYDAILIKENHIAAAGSITAAINAARKISSLMVEVEVENLQEFKEALAASPDRILLDNFTIEDIVQAVTLNEHRVELEASGNIQLDNIRLVAETGVDFISIGALTKNITAIDLSMRINLEVEND